MQFDWWTLALQTVNFLVLVWLLHRFLYKPVLGIIDARRAEIDAKFAEARGTQSEAQTELTRLKAERADIAAERAAALESAAKEAEAASVARHAKAEAEATALLARTRKSLASERELAESEVRQRVFDLAVAMAQQLLNEFPAELRAEAWLARVDEYLAALSPADRDDIRRQMSNGETLRVASAAPLSDTAIAKWRKRLEERLGKDAAIAFDTEPALIAGVELHLPHAILRFSWRSVIETMQSEIGHENAG